ncbi:protein mono-ADP-ribosyltransferase PARP14-like [Physella acuta]|uniref:protein mono-ADP-ribosyltransferase PARP14-like n=1 Tax=Physella acuta TaxID=109671 RepID=UPI0027DD49BA|nr:protein mono-ADP-ribosyltransferase PARP14-like [Physella acuta]
MDYKKKMFVTFKSNQDAENFCENRPEEINNVASVSMATLEEIDIYSNMISIHSRQPIKEVEKLNEHLNKLTGVEIIKTHQYTEKRSIIIEFSPQQCLRENLPALIWKCAGDFMDQYLICAPVQKSRMILVEGIDEKISDDSLKQYFTNKCSSRRSGVVEKLDRLDPTSSIVMFKAVEDAEKITNQTEFFLGNKTLSVKNYFSCLTKEVYQRCFYQTQKLYPKLSEEGLLNSKKIDKVLNKSLPQASDIKEIVVKNKKEHETKKKLNKRINDSNKSFTLKGYGTHTVLTFGSVTLKVKYGDLTEEKCDAIVIALNEDMNYISSNAVSHSVWCKYMRNISGECKNEAGDIWQNGLIVKSSWRFPFTKIFHLSTKKFAQHWDSGLKLVLEEAERQGVKSLAFPALGCSRISKDDHLKKKLYFQALEQFGSNSLHTLSDLRLVILDKKLWNTFTVEGTVTVVNFGSVTLKIKNGDLIEEKCDAIVIEIDDNMNLIGSNAVSFSLRRRSSLHLQLECLNKVSDIKQDGLAVTSSGCLPCDKIFHLSTKKFAQHWDSGLKLVLEEAERQGVKSLAFPALGCTMISKDEYKNKKLYFQAIEQFGSSNIRTLTDLRLVILDKTKLDIFSFKESLISKENTIASTLIHQHKNLTTLCDSTKEAKELIKHVNDECRKNAVTEIFKKDDLKKLDSTQIKNLVDFGLENQVIVKLNEVKGSATLQGLQQNVSKVKEKISDTIIDHYKSLQHAIPVAIQWQFQDNTEWKNFDPIINAELENAVKKNKSFFDLKESKSIASRIDFKNMTKLNIKTDGTNEFNTIKIRRIDQIKDHQFPLHWSEMEESEHLKLITLQPGSDEYNQVEKGFKITAKKIIQIERIQNKTLYQQYAAKREEIVGRNPRGHENEKILYHGTNYKNVDAINLTGFSRNYINVAVYGEGVYFATDPTFSVNYANPDSNGIKKMYQARVLVGESAVTKCGDRHPPNKPGKIYTYDSGTDGNGVMYIIFHDAQAYPEYMITFS